MYYSVFEFLNNTTQPHDCTLIKLCRFCIIPGPFFKLITVLVRILQYLFDVFKPHLWHRYILASRYNNKSSSNYIYMYIMLLCVIFNPVWPPPYQAYIILSSPSPVDFVSIYLKGETIGRPACFICALLWSDSVIALRLYAFTFATTNHGTSIDVFSQ